ncbi:MAG: MerR family transcriptional regulator [Candidatus Dependentiae bacterium]|jgi:DNA-binding transcriptional MerR regulator
MAKARKQSMAKRQFRIGELARALNVENYVVRFWEKEFKLEGTRSVGGQRFYTNDDLELFQRIKDLLYNQGFTIAGARKQLAQKGSRTRSYGAAISDKSTADKEAKLTEQLLLLKDELKKLKQKLG